MPMKLVFAALALSFPISAHAGALAPKKPSDLRTISGIPSDGVCPGQSNDDIRGPVANQNNPDGTHSTFSIPPGSVFVITSWDWETDVNATNSFRSTDLVIVDPSTGFQSIVGRSGGITDGSGFGGGVVQTPPGVAVKSGMNICFDMHGSSFFYTVIVHGFMTKDN
jgi:hypothetical protein